MTKQYDKFAKKYQILTENLEKETREHTYSLISKNLKGSKILDVGCGSGCDAKYYSQKGAKVFGIDISKKEIEIANKRNIGKFKVAKMEKIPSKDNTFDIVTSVYALQSSKEVTKSIKEMIRVAKKGAEIIILTKHPFRNLIEGRINNKKKNYFKQSKVTSFIFNRKIKLVEPSHTLMEYFTKEIFEKANLELFEEYEDFPASEQIVRNFIYPTYMILKYRKK